MTMRSRSKRAEREGGFALAAVLFVLALLGMLSITSLVTTDDERRASHGMRESAKAFYAAEAGANLVLATWDSLRYDTLFAGPGDSADLGWETLPENGTSYRAVIQRVDNASPTIYALNVEGRGVGLWGGQRAITMALIAGTTTLPPISAAIGMVDGAGSPPLEATFNGNSWDVQGKDSEMQSVVDNPANLPAGCTAPTSENKPGFGVGSPESETYLGTKLNATQRDKFKGLKKGSTTNEYDVRDSYDDVTTTTAEELQALVDALSPGATLLTDVIISYDLGTPTAPGVFLADGDLTFTGNGYGVLIVTGDFKITGNSLWEGLILVVGTGNASFTGSSNKIFGAVLTANTVGSKSTLYLAGNAEVAYSSQALCRLVEAGLLGLSPIVLVSGSWMELSR